MSWLFLVLAGILEIVWAYTMKLSNGFTRPLLSLVTLIAMAGSFGLLALAMRTIPLSVAYTVWTGIGACGAFVVGITLLGEPVSATKFLAAGLIVSGLILMKISTV